MRENGASTRAPCVSLENPSADALKVSDQGVRLRRRASHMSIQPTPTRTGATYGGVRNVGAVCFEPCGGVTLAERWNGTKDPPADTPERSLRAFGSSGASSHEGRTNGQPARLMAC